jgi:orotidine-5'-phosphate decarboxylase
MKSDTRTANFAMRLDQSVDQSNSLLCVGLDPVVAKLPPSAPNQFEFNKAIIDATADIASVYKPNPAFYEARGAEGVEALKRTCDYIKSAYPTVQIIVDAKRGDIGNTNAGYVEYVFDYLGADAVTVAPYMGSESLGAFLERDDKGIIVLCRTSNPGAGEFQDLLVDGEKLYLHVAKQVVDKWNTRGNVALMVGATYPQELGEVRAIAGPQMPILVAGIGAQGGDLAGTLAAGLGERSRGLIISASRSVIFASAGEDFAAAARTEAIRLRDAINNYRGGEHTS